MQRSFQYILSLVGILIFVMNSFGQNGIVNLRFSAIQVNGSVYLDWTMNLGQTCNGIDIVRSTDSLNFVTIGNIPGICGSPTDTVSYFFSDESPVPNGVNYYRLVMGNLGPSQTIAVEIIDLNEVASQVRPNPVGDMGRVYFKNDLSEPHLLTLFSLDGSAVKRLTTRNDFFELDSSNLHAGVYAYKITTLKGSPKANGKLLIAR